MTVDRLTPGYEPSFDIDLEVGRQGELYVVDVAQMLADGTGRVEVKVDEQAARTGNVYVEYQCLRGGEWRPSGIATTSAHLWAFVIAGRVMVVAPTECVRSVARSHFPSRRKQMDRGSHPTRGLVIPTQTFIHEVIQATTERAAA